MVNETLEQTKQVVTKDECLRLMVAQMLRPIFRRQHLDKGNPWAFLCGFIGDRGGGKSGSCAVVSMTDGMMGGFPLYSNMDVAINVEVDDTIAQSYGLNSGGIVSYRSNKLEKDALLSIARNEKYARVYFLIEEINVEYSNVRRIMSNTNVDFNQTAQQLRHLGSSLLYNVIDEMFIDPQLRTLTDVFVKTYDTAFDVENLFRQKERGLDFQWTVYPMTGYLAGEQGKYIKTKKPLPPMYLHFGDWRGIYNDLTNQAQGMYTISTKEKNARLTAEWSIKSSPEMVQQINRDQWAIDLAQRLKERNIRELTPVELRMEAGKGLNKLDRETLQDFGVFYDNSIGKYVVNLFKLERETHSHARH